MSDVKSLAAEILERQNQTMLDTSLTQHVGIDSRGISDMAKKAEEIIKGNTDRIRERDRVDDDDSYDTTERDKLIKQGQSLIDEIEQNNQNYNATNIYLDKMKQLIRWSKKEKKTLTNSVDGILATVHTNNRRIDYQSPEVERVTLIRNILIIFFYVLLVFFIFRIGFFKRSLYRDYRTVLLILICGALPFTIDNFVLFCAWLWHSISGFFNKSVHRNVYVNI